MKQCFTKEFKLTVIQNINARQKTEKIASWVQDIIAAIVQW